MYQSNNLCPPPNNFRPAGNFEHAELALQAPPFITDIRRTGRRAQGIRYERKGHKHLQEVYPKSYVAGPWFRFWPVRTASPLWCQPDGLIVDLPENRITIIEFKLKHTPTAWWQTRKLYEPIVRHVFGLEWDYAICEVVRWFDPRTQFPERFSFTKFPHEAPVGRIAVHLWGGRA
jgi:hypothetical protein